MGAQFWSFLRPKGPKTPAGSRNSIFLINLFGNGCFEPVKKNLSVYLKWLQNKGFFKIRKSPKILILMWFCRASKFFLTKYQIFYLKFLKGGGSNRISFFACFDFGNKPKSHFSPNLPLLGLKMIVGHIFFNFWDKKNFRVLRPGQKIFAPKNFFRKNLTQKIL